MKYIHYYKNPFNWGDYSFDANYYHPPRYKNSAIGFSFINGVQFYLWKRFAIDIISGIGNYKTYKTKIYEPDGSITKKTGKDCYGMSYDLKLNKKFDLTFGLNVGFRF